MLPRLLCDPCKEPCKQALLTPGLRRKCLYLCTPKRSKFEFVNLWSVLATSMLPQSILARGEGFHAIDKPVHPDHPQVLRSFQVRIVACRFVEEKSHYLPLPSVYQDTWSRGDLRQARNKISLCTALRLSSLEVSILTRERQSFILTMMEDYRMEYTNTTFSQFASAQNQGTCRHGGTTVTPQLGVWISIAHVGLVSFVMNGSSSYLTLCTKCSS